MFDLKALEVAVAEKLLAALVAHAPAMREEIKTKIVELGAKLIVAEGSHIDPKKISIDNAPDVLSIKIFKDNL